MPALKEKSKENGAENKSEDKSILAMFTKNAPLISFFKIKSSATPLAKPILTPGAIKVSGKRVSRYEKTRQIDVNCGWSSFRDFMHWF